VVESRMCLLRSLDLSGEPVSCKEGHLLRPWVPPFRGRRAFVRPIEHPSARYLPWDSAFGGRGRGDFALHQFCRGFPVRQIYTGRHKL
jgi:hypothetical protein